MNEENDFLFIVVIEILGLFLFLLESGILVLFFLELLLFLLLGKVFLFGKFDNFFGVMFFLRLLFILCGLFLF